MSDHVCAQDAREKAMTVIVPGKIWCDPCIAPLVRALNDGGIPTIASCCGHGHRPGRITLADGRELIIADDFETAQKVDDAFPVDINGETRV